MKPNLSDFSQVTTLAAVHYGRRQLLTGPVIYWARYEPDSWLAHGLSAALSVLTLVPRRLSCMSYCMSYCLSYVCEVKRSHCWSVLELAELRVGVCRRFLFPSLVWFGLSSWGRVIFRKAVNHPTSFVGVGQKGAFEGPELAFVS